MTTEPQKKSFISPQKKVYYGGMLLFVGFLLIFILPSDLFISGGLFLIGSILLLAFLFNLKWGLYALFLFSFFANWFIYLGKYQWFKNIAYLSSIDAPVVDFIALILGLGLFLAWLLMIHPLQFKKLKHIWRLIVLYAIFIVCAGFSAMKAFDHNIAVSLKYLMRPMLFSFIFFVIMPHFLIEDKKTLLTVLKIWFVVGVGIALFGLSSLLVVPQSGWLRVTPYTVEGVAPLGYNHNLIAEALIALIPLGIYFGLKAREEENEQAMIIYFGGTILMILAELLTLSRGGWITLVIQALVGLWFFWSYLKDIFKEYRLAFLPLFVVAAGVLAYMAVFLTSSIVKASTQSRLTATQIVLFYVERSPLFGYGPGMFIPIFESTRDFIQEYGVALDGHGFIQKVALEDGIVGLVLFTAILVYILFYTWKAQHRAREDRMLYIFLFIMVVGEIIFQSFNTSYFISVLWLPIGVALTAAGFLKKEEKNL